MTSPPSSPSQPQGEAQELQTQNPNSNQDDDNEIQHQQHSHSQSQSSETHTLECPDPQNPEQSEAHQTQNQQQEDLQVLGQEGDQHHHQEPDDRPQQSGMSTFSPTHCLAPLFTNPRDPNPSRRPNRRKKVSNKMKQQAIERRFQTLTRNLKPIPFAPSKTLDFDKHEKLLKQFGLWDFVHIEFDSNIRVDLIAQLIATYDARYRCSYVNEFRIAVNRAAFARAFNLPVKKDKGNAPALSSEIVNLNLEALSEESIAFLEDFVSNWFLLHEDTWMMPMVVLNWRRAIKEGQCEKVDWAGFIWFMVEKELLQGKQLEDCYYASHMQYLIKSQRQEVFWEEPKVEVKEEEHVENPKVVAEVEVNVEEGDEEPKVEAELEVKEEGCGEEPKVEAELELEEEEGGEEPKVVAELELEEEEGGEEPKVVAKVEVKGEEGDGEPKVEAELELKKEASGEELQPKVEAELELKEEEDGEELQPKVEVEFEVKEEEEGGEEPKVKAELELKDEEGGEELQPKVEAEFEVKEEAGGEEPKVEAALVVMEEEDGGGMNMAGPHDFWGQKSREDVLMEEPKAEFTSGEEIVEKEEVKDGNMMDIEESKEVQGHWLWDGKNTTGNHFLQPCNTEDDRGMDSDEERKPEEEEDDEEEEEEDDGFNLTSRSHTSENDGLTGDILQGMETAQIPFNMLGQLCDQSDMQLLASRTETRTSSGRPSILGDGSKRVADQEHDILHDSLNGSNKRLRTDGMWVHKSSDFEMCMEQMNHWMGEAKMMYVAKEQACEESNMNQQIILSELQRRDRVIEHLQTTKCEELQRKDGEIYRLEREFYVMSNVLEGYRKALKETHKAFIEYRQRCQLPEEPLYKDAGPGGIILSTMELEKQCLKQEEEDRLNRILIEQKAKEFEEEFFSKLEAHLNEVQKLDKLLMDFENEVKLLKELSAKRKFSETSELHQSSH